MTGRPSSVERRPRVVVVGGGFGGIAAVRGLARTPVEIILIDRHIYNTFSPLLYQVATAALNAGDITWFLRAIRARQDNVHFLKGIVLGIDHAECILHLHGDVHVAYDYLVLANGVTANFFGIPGAEQYAMPLYKRSQALALRDRMLKNLEDFAINGQERDERIVVVGGGATGVETAGALAEFRNHDMPIAYPELDRRRIHVTLVERGPSVLSPFPEKLRRYAQRSLEQRRVDLRLGTAVKEVRADGVVVENDHAEEFLSAGVVVWASGITVHPTVGDWGVPQGHGGRIEVDEYQRIKGFSKEFAVGDVSIGPKPLPQQAQPAIQGGRYVAKYIAVDVAHLCEQIPPFKYHDKGTMAVIGRASAVARVKHLPLMTGLIAWIIWVVLHIASLLGVRNRIATLANLAVKYLSSGSYNAIVGETPIIVARRRIIFGNNVRPASETEAAACVPGVEEETRSPPKKGRP
ncbi:MAG: NAD(P)/FAD-dependent oxidoreductase [Nitrococcus sp.]|nr:NAD(P)/FAD-dependent oxidoreductase [Nitrococcus sp.]